MSWFGLGGGGNKEEDTGSSEKGFMDGAADDHFASSVPMQGGGSGMADFQQFSMALQQQMLIQTVITDLTQRSFEKCVTSATKDPKLSGREVACIYSITNKWLDSNELMMGRLAKKQQAASQQQF
jgi:hypothetical protein